MPADLPLMLQTVYADLLDRVTAGAFAEAFSADGMFTVKSVRGRRYWYFQQSAADGRRQKYVGPETPELLQRIAEHKAGRAYRQDQRSLVAMLVRGGNLPRPTPQIGGLVAALADAGVFRLRGVIVGTVAYQTYSAMLGVRLPATMAQTSDVDVAQGADVSAAVIDATKPMPDVLRHFDPTFRPVPHIHAGGDASYLAASGLRVDFLTPNRGRETEEPQHLPALGTDAQPLRFLDFLIREPEPAVLLHGTGVLVSVPAPQRFALHKLIVSRRRRDGDAKREKDRHQAESLLTVLAERRPHELRAAWDEAFARGRTWRRLLGEGLGLLHPKTRDSVLRAIGAPRSVIPGLRLEFLPGKEGYDEGSQEGFFFARCGAEGIRCGIARDALQAGFGLDTIAPAACLETLRRHRVAIELASETKYLQQPVGAEHDIVLTRTDMLS